MRKTSHFLLSHALIAALLAACATNDTDPRSATGENTEVAPDDPDDPEDAADDGEAIDDASVDDDASDPADPTPDEDLGADEPEPADGIVVDVTVADGEVTGAEERVSVPVGSDVTLTVSADIDDEIHVHGYDIHQDVAAGDEASVSFAADIPGVFEVELEDTALLLVRLEVQ